MYVYVLFLFTRSMSNYSSASADLSYDGTSEYTVSIDFDGVFVVVDSIGTALSWFSIDELNATLRT